MASHEIIKIGGLVVGIIIFLVLLTIFPDMPGWLIMILLIVGVSMSGGGGKK